MSQATHSFPQTSSSRPGLRDTRSAKKSDATRPGWLQGRAFSGRGELRYANFILIILNVVLVAGLFYTNFAWYRHAAALAEKQYLVFHDQGGTTTVHSASEFRSGPSDEEIRGRAWQVVRWYLEASSSNYQTAYAEARAMMDQSMQRQFDEAIAPRISELKDLNIFRKLENARVRQLEPKDLPAGVRTSPTRYDVVVEGVLDTYRAEGKTRPSLNADSRISTGPVAIWIHLTPLERRTEQNPSGLVVSSMMMLDIKPPATPSSPAAGPITEKGVAK